MNLVKKHFLLLKVDATIAGLGEPKNACFGVKESNRGLDYIANNPCWQRAVDEQVDE